MFLSISVRATGLLCLLGIGIGFGSIFIYKLYTRLFQLTLPPSRQHSDDTDCSNIVPSVDSSVDKHTLPEVSIIDMLFFYNYEYEHYLTWKCYSIPYVPVVMCHWHWVQFSIWIGIEKILMHMFMYNILYQSMQNVNLLSIIWSVQSSWSWNHLGFYFGCKHLVCLFAIECYWICHVIKLCLHPVTKCLQRIQPFCANLWVYNLRPFDMNRQPFTNFWCVSCAWNVQVIYFEILILMFLGLAFFLKLFMSKV